MTADAPISRLDLERFVLGRLEPAAQADIDARVAADPELQARVARLRADIESAATDLPAFQIPTEAGPPLKVAPAPAPAAPARRFRWGPVVGGVMAAAAGWMLVVQTDAPIRGETFRGSFDLQVEQVRAGSGTSVGLVVEARSGDTLQYTLTPSADGWWMVADIQDDGKVSLWTPPRRATAGTPDRAAVQLDDYTGSERAFFLLSESPIELEAVEAAYAEAYRKPLVELDTLPGLPAQQRSILIVRAPSTP